MEEKYSKWLMRLQWSEQWAAVASRGVGGWVGEWVEVAICHSTHDSPRLILLHSIFQYCAFKTSLQSLLVLKL